MSEAALEIIASTRASAALHAVDDVTLRRCRMAA